MNPNNPRKPRLEPKMVPPEKPCQKCQHFRSWDWGEVYKRIKAAGASRQAVIEYGVCYGGGNDGGYCDVKEGRTNKLDWCKHWEETDGEYRVWPGTDDVLEIADNIDYDPYYAGVNLKSKHILNTPMSKGLP